MRGIIADESIVNQVLELEDLPEFRGFGRICECQYEGFWLLLAEAVEYERE